MALSAGSVLGGNVVLERELGHGAMGTVWLAENRSLGSKVAVKVLRGAAHDAPSTRLRFEQEARAAARIDSPHVVRIFDYGVTDEGDPYFVMELLRGTDLRHRIQQTGPLSLAETATIVRQTCRALESAHRLDIVHRDIKPANVFILESGGEPFVKLLDFGIAKHLGAGDMGLTAADALMGTPYYMSPEQFLAARDVDLRTDLWSTAVVTYACLTGALPFVAEMASALALAVHRGEFVPASHLRPDLPPAIDAWFARGLAPDREERFQSAREMADGFEAIARAAPSAPPRPELVVTQDAAETTGSPAAQSQASAPAPMPAPTLDAAPAGNAAPPRRSPLAWLAPMVLLLAVGGTYAITRAVHAAEDRAAPPTLDAPPSAQSSDSHPPPAQEHGAEAGSTATPQATTSAAPPQATTRTAPPRAPASKWRKRKMRCAAYHSSKSCAGCCLKGDVLEPYPSCECLFDGEKWDREHGVAR